MWNFLFGKKKPGGGSAPICCGGCAVSDEQVTGRPETPIGEPEEPSRVDPASPCGGCAVVRDQAVTCRLETPLGFDSAPLCGGCAVVSGQAVVCRPETSLGAPQLGVNRYGRPVTPHRCDLEASASSLRLKSASSSVSTIPAVRPAVTAHKCVQGSSSTGLEPQFKQFKSPTVPKYRPIVTPHHCSDIETREDTGDVKKRKKPAGKSNPVFKKILLLLLLLGALGAMTAAVKKGLIKFPVLFKRSVKRPGC